MSNIVPSREFTNDQVALIKKSIAPTATPAEFELFLYRCKHMDLDPLKPGQIHFVKYGNSAGTIIVGIEGFRTRASKTGKHSGTKRGVLRDDKGRCIGAWCEVYRSDWSQPAREEVSLHEYDTGKAQWAKMPETMIKKVAECAALRMAFPDELGGVYERAEMDQAENGRNVTPPDDGPDPEYFKPEDFDHGHPEMKQAEGGDYEISFGKFDGKTIREVVEAMGLPYLENYINWLHEQRGARPPQPWLTQFCSHFERYKRHLASQAVGA